MRYQRAAQPLKLDGPEAARAFFASCFAESDPARECLWVAHVNQDRCCVHLARHQGIEGATLLPVRSIISDAVQHGSAGILLAHNHPSGQARPSPSDCIATRRLHSITQALDCPILDHFIFAGGASSSFRQLGLL